MLKNCSFGQHIKKSGRTVNFMKSLTNRSQVDDVTVSQVESPVLISWSEDLDKVTRLGVTGGVRKVRVIRGHLTQKATKRNLSLFSQMFSTEVTQIKKKEVELVTLIIQKSQ